MACKVHHEILHFNDIHDDDVISSASCALAIVLARVNQSSSQSCYMRYNACACLVIVWSRNKMQ